jgi:hypothetical protein
MDTKANRGGRLGPLAETQFRRLYLARALSRDLADGWRVFRSETWLWVDGVYSALGNCAVFAPFLALGPVVALRSLGGAGAWATIMAALGVRSISAGLVLLRARPARPLFVGVILLSLLALPTALLALPAPTVVIAVGALAGGFGVSVFNTLFETTVQQFVAPEALAWVASIDWLMSLGLFPIGFAVPARRQQRSAFAFLSWQRRFGSLGRPRPSWRSPASDKSGSSKPLRSTESR